MSCVVVNGWSFAGVAAVVASEMAKAGHCSSLARHVIATVVCCGIPRAAAGAAGVAGRSATPPTDAAVPSKAA